MSTVHFFCVMCGSSLFRGAQSTRPLVECPKCSHVVPVPDPLRLPGEGGGLPPVFPRGVLSLELIFLCSHCHCHIQIDARGEGQAVDCPRCRREVTVPQWSQRVEAEEVVSLSADEVNFLTGLTAGDG